MEYTEKNLPELSKILIQKFKDHTNEDSSLIVALHGNLGSGKTTLTQYLAKELGVTEAIQSPTFVIQKNYKSTNRVFKEIVHIDAYRIEDLKEMKPLGFIDTATKENTLIIIEWPEQISEIIPENTFNIFLEYNNQDSRTIKVLYQEKELSLKLN